jgi:hypothetical protein
VNHTGFGKAIDLVDEMDALRSSVGGEGLEDTGMKSAGD